MGGPNGNIGRARFGRRAGALTATVALVAALGTTGAGAASRRPGVLPGGEAAGARPSTSARAGAGAEPRSAAVLARVKTEASANAGEARNDLYATTMISGADAWAVGDYEQITPAASSLVGQASWSGVYLSLAEHWDGAHWTAFPTPDVPNDSDTFWGVGASANADVWAVGQTYDFAQGHDLTFAEHWTGAAWAIVATPNVGTGDNLLNSVSVISPSNAWAVGQSTNSKGNIQPLIEHWNGVKWTVVANNATVNKNHPSTLYTVSATSASDVWAAGYFFQTATSDYQVLLEHYDGSSWTQVAQPAITTGGSPAIFSLDAIASNDVWAVGNYYATAKNDFIPLTEHWDGSTWTVVKTPALPQVAGDLNGVSAVSSSAVYAVGDAGNGTAPLVEEWTGAAWAKVKAPTTGVATFLGGVTAVAAGQVIAVGTTADLSANTEPIVDNLLTSKFTLGKPATRSASYNKLYTVSASSASDVWTGDFAYQQSTNSLQTMLEHYDGTRWSVVPTPNASTGDNHLTGVVAKSPTDADAVGYYTNADGVEQTLAERWQSGSWAIVPTPNVGDSTNILFQGASDAAGGVWAVGYTIDDSGVYHDLIEHFDGSTWSVVPSPGQDETHNYILYGVTATSATTALAVGYVYDYTSESYSTLVERWNGASWSVQSTPALGQTAQFEGVTAVSPTEAWAVGDVYDATATEFVPLVEHWNGSVWKQVKTPALGAGGGYLQGIANLDGTHVYAVGGVTPSTGNQTLVETWNGTKWSIVKSPNAGAGADELASVAAVPGAGAFWGVGQSTTTEGVGQTLTMKITPN